MERTAVATKSWEALGTLQRGLRAKWVRQRCQTAPGRQEATASTSPEWASETTRRTPESPRATRPRRNDVQPAPSSVVMKSQPRTSRCPSAFTAMATTQEMLTTRPPSLTFWVSASSQR